MHQNIEITKVEWRDNGIPVLSRRSRRSLFLDKRRGKRQHQSGKTITRQQRRSLFMQERNLKLAAIITRQQRRSLFMKEYQRSGRLVRIFFLN
jgi:hypothetical protein